MSLRAQLHRIAVCWLVMGLSSVMFAAQTTVNISGGEQGGGTVPFDVGSLTLTVNGRSETVSFGQFSTIQSVASGLAANFSLDCGGSVVARAQGYAITFTTKNSSDTFFQVSSGAVWNSANFPLSSFYVAQDSPPTGSTILPPLTLTCDPDPVASGGSAGCTAKLPTGATGSVSFSIDNQSPWSSAQVDGEGWAQADVLNSLQAGNHEVQASYSGDNHYSAAIQSLTLPVLTGTLGSAFIYNYSITQPDGVTSGYAPTDNILAYFDSVNGRWSLQYDSLNRLTGPASVVPSSGGPEQYWCWTYDSFGNRTLETSSNSAFQGVTCSAAGSASSNWTSYFSNNQIAGTPALPAGLPYDQAGNLEYDGSNSYLYDAEGRVCAMGVAPPTGGFVEYQYIYDAEGRRVAKGTNQPAVVNGQYTLSCNLSGISITNSYVFGQGGEQVTEMLVAGGQSSWAHTNVFAGGVLLATYDPVGLHFQLRDWLGNRRVQTNAFGQVEEKCQNNPFGNGLSCSFPDGAPVTADDATEHHFTGKERDTESGLDYFGARYYASSMGRFMSPDWSAKEEPVPYAKLDDPQSLNLYGYVGNNPLSRTDADGHQWPDWVQRAWKVISYPGILNDPSLSPAQKQAAVRQAVLQHNAAGRQLLADGVALLAAAASAEAPTPSGGLKSSMWDLAPSPRGFAIEAELGANLPRNFPTIDKFDNGAATSIKSLDLNANSYQNSGALTSTVNGYIDKVAGFNGASSGGVEITAGEVTSRELQLAVPGAGTAAQQAALRASSEYAAQQGVKLTITQVK